MIRTILIDPKAKRLKEVFIKAHDLNSIYTELGCNNFETTPFIPLRLGDDIHTHDIYCDGDGLFKEEQYFFFNKATGSPIAGKSLVIGLDENSGDSRSCLWSIDGIKRNISWIGDRNTLQLMLERKIISINEKPYLSENSGEFYV